MVNISFLDLIEADRIKRIMKSFHDLTGIPSTLIDLDGNILTSFDGDLLAVGWQDLCLNFHRVNPETLKKCIESDTKLSNNLKDGDKFACYQCLNGLVDIAVPIYVGGEHIANLFTGQFFFEPPDEEFFRKQAAKYGFDEEKYLKALSKVPVFSQLYIENGMSFLTELAEMIGEMGLKQKELVEANKKLKKGENKLLTTIKSIPMPMGIYDLQTHEVVMINDKFTEIMGYTNGDIHKEVKWWRLLFPDEKGRKMFQKEWLKRREEIQTTRKDIVPLETEIITKYGEKRQVSFYMRLLDGEAVVTMVDLTQIEEAKEKEIEHYEEQKIISEVVIKLIKAKSDDEVAGILKDAVKKLLPRAYVGITFLKTYGETVHLEKILGIEKYLKYLKKFGIDLHKIDFPLGQTQNLEANQIGELSLSEEGIYGLSEKKIPKSVSQAICKILSIGEIYSIIFSWGKNHYGGFFIALRQGQKLKHQRIIETIVQQAFISIQRISAEQSLRNSEAKYRKFINSTSDMAYLKDSKCRYIMVNRANQQFFGKKEEEIIGKTDFELMPIKMAQGCNLTDLQAIENGEVVVNTETIEDLIYETVKFPVKLESGEIGVGGFIRDITEQKRAEEALEKSLKEKDVLLQEIHHRVKNNMQIISSFLSLQKKYVKEEESIDTLTESQNRVKTMAIIHEKLYQSPNLTNINFKEYIESLVWDLFYTYGYEKGNVQPIFDLDEVNIGLDTAIPCGLIINELVSNSLKYAFPSRKGTIIIEFKSKGEEILLKVADNGVGLPADIEPENAETLGLKLVYILTKQLEGELELDRTHGTEFTIRFKELHYKNRIEDV